MKLCRLLFCVLAVVISQANLRADTSRADVMAAVVTVIFQADDPITVTPTIAKAGWEKAAGFRFGDNGYIMTVLDSASMSKNPIWIRDTKHDHAASVVAFDPWSGLTVLKAEEDTAGSTSLKFSQTPVAVGDSVWTAYEHRHRVSGIARGIVCTDSHFAPEIGTFAQYTDISVLRSCLGAPLLNERNEIVGVLGGLDSSDGIRGRAIAISDHAFSFLVEQVKDGVKGKIQTGFLGAAFNPVHNENGPDQGRQVVSTGAVVVHVLPDSPAEASGLLKGDVVKAVNDVEFNRFEDVVGLIRHQRPSEKIKLAIDRGDTQIIINVKLGKRTGLFAENSRKLMAETSEETILLIEEMLQEKAGLTDAQVEKLKKSLIEAKRLQQQQEHKVAEESPQAVSVAPLLPLSPTGTFIRPPSEHKLAMDELTFRAKAAQLELRHTQSSLNSIRELHAMSVVDSNGELPASVAKDTIRLIEQTLEEHAASFEFLKNWTPETTTSVKLGTESAESNSAQNDVTVVDIRVKAEEAIAELQRNQKTLEKILDSLRSR